MSTKEIVHILHYRIVCIIRYFLSIFLGKGESVRPVTKDILKLPATTLATKIRQKKITSVQVLEAFIQRIEEINPLLNCVVDNRFEDARKEAAEADELIASNKYTADELEREKPFLGVPISTKDCLAVKGMLHTSGILARKYEKGSEDSVCMSYMRKAGAIPFALTNVSEACMWWESNNLVHGRSKNAYDTNRIVGGSSGGEGCLLSASGSPIGIGSDIGGSIRMPAFFNGVFGHKPSKFVVSNEGQWPMPHDDQKPFLGLGPMSRFAVDLKPALKIMSGENAVKLNLDEPIDVSSIRIFYQTDDGGGHLISPVDSAIREAMDKVIKHFDSKSKVKPTRKQIKRFKKSSTIWMGNMKSPSNADKFDSQLLNLKGRINPYLELAKWFIGQSNHTFIAIMTALTERGGVVYGSSKHKYMVNEKNELLKEFDLMLGTNGVFLYPTHPTVAPYHNEPIIRALNFSYTAIFNVLGFPATACPLGLDKNGLPIGIQVVGNLNQDRLCLAIACELETVFGGFKQPGAL